MIRLVCLICSLGLSLMILTPPPTLAVVFTEDFSTTYYKSSLTTAVWDTGAGELRAPAFAPSLVGSVATPGAPFAVEVVGDYAYVADQTGGFRVIDISDPDVPVLDAMAVVTEAGDLVLWLVHRGATCGPVALTVTLADFRAHARADVVTLAGETWHARNTLEDPERVVPRASQVDVQDGRHLTVHLPPFSLTRVTLTGMTAR